MSGQIRYNGDENGVQEKPDFYLNEAMITKEINDIEREIKEKKLDKKASEWVEDWNNRKQENVKDAKREEIRNFVTASLDPEKKIEDNTLTLKVIKSGRVLYIRYIALAAAVLTGAFFLVRSLLPGSDPESLFNSYYSPLRAIPAVTRSLNADISESYSSAFENYRNGRYEEASVGFSDLLKKNYSLVSARFFLGITDIALEEYDKASQMLKEVTASESEYTKEARWYLGLVLLKTGDTKGAEENFRMLAESPGFYSDRSEKILRRLK